MEVSLADAEGLPPGCVLSFCAGTMRRQGPADTQKLRLQFPRGPLFAGHCKVDLLAPIGSCSLLLQQGVERYVLEVPTAASVAHLALRVRDLAASEVGAADAARNAAAAAGIAGTRPGSANETTGPRRHRVALAARGYLDEHRLLEWVQGLLQDIIRDRPGDPWEYIDACTAAARKQGVKDPAPGAGPPPPPDVRPGECVSPRVVEVSTPPSRSASLAPESQLDGLSGTRPPQGEAPEVEPLPIEAPEVRQARRRKCKSMISLEERPRSGVDIHLETQALLANARVDGRLQAILAEIHRERRQARPEQDDAQIQMVARTLLARASIDGRLQAVCTDIRRERQVSCEHGSADDDADLRELARRVLAEANADGRLRAQLAQVAGDSVQAQAPAEAAMDSQSRRRPATDALAEGISEAIPTLGVLWESCPEDAWALLYSRCPGPTKPDLEKISAPEPTAPADANPTFGTLWESCPQEAWALLYSRFPGPPMLDLEANAPSEPTTRAQAFRALADAQSDGRLNIELARFAPPPTELGDRVRLALVEAQDNGQLKAALAAIPPPGAAVRKPKVTPADFTVQAPAALVAELQGEAAVAKKSLAELQGTTAVTNKSVAELKETVREAKSDFEDLRRTAGQFMADLAFLRSLAAASSLKRNGPPQLTPQAELRANPQIEPRADATPTLGPLWESCPQEAWAVLYSRFPMSPKPDREAKAASESRALLEASAAPVRFIPDDDDPAEKDPSMGEDCSGTLGSTAATDDAKAWLGTIASNATTDDANATLGMLSTGDFNPEAIAKSVAELQGKTAVAKKSLAELKETTREAKRDMEDLRRMAEEAMKDLRSGSRVEPRASS